MKTPKNNVIVAELQRIASRHGGILKPSAVVKSAENPASPLHSQFEWDDQKASHAHRLWQARQLISVCVQVMPNGDDKSSERVWVSLRKDREEGGYRALIEVLSDADLRSQLLEEALADMEYFSSKYERLTELAEVFRTMEKTKRKVKAGTDGMGQLRPE